MKKKTIDKHQIPFDFDNTELSHWPPNEKFPLNLSYSYETRTVDQEINKDLEQSNEYLIVTGFTSLSNIIEKFGSSLQPNLKKIRIVLGWEPNPYGRKTYPLVDLAKEIKEFWLKKGLSIIHGGAVIQLIELIENHQIEFRFRNKLHAKIYVGSKHAILGSANFSINGLKKQEEANIRVSASPEGSLESIQYDSIKLIAEKFFDIADPYDEKIIELLKDLIQKVTWEEALARAIAEVIEGDWLSEYAKLFEELNSTNLWPTQWKGIAQAMSIIQSRSNVLIADPTGAGKTKLTSALILTLVHWLWENGKYDKTNSLVVCPPLVIENWRNEFRDLSKVNYSQISMWRFSNAGKKKMDDAINDITLADIVALDEAHNYLNPDSNRSKAVQFRKAEHTLLITATPINKKADDLLRLIELLDVDNLSDSDFELFKKLKGRPNKKFEDQDLKSLKRFISQFLMRRTKSQLNKEILKDRSKYLNKEGKECKFPTQECPIYKTMETENDIKIATKISELTKKLKGLIYLRNIRKPDYELKTVEEQQNFINIRLKSATALVGYMIRSSLRSSHVALIEHIQGSEIAMKTFNFKTKKNKTGDQISKLEKFKDSLPKKGFDRSLFPKWLIEKESYIIACEEEIAIYKRIANLAYQLSGEREIGKVKHLIKLQKKHKLIVAFDSTVITLDYMNSLFKREQSKSKILVVAGNVKSVRNEAINTFKLGSKVENCIALCSDQMAEGVNLQQASAVVLLDMPSVLRIAEQRIGRIDRMDSPHETIEAYWPDDSKAFGLSGDQRLVDTTILVENIYGSNIALPNILREKHFRNIGSVKQAINEYKEFVKKDIEWEGVQNSFQPIIDLKEGDNPLIPESTYEAIKNIRTTIKARVSFVGGESNWCFFALRGSKNKSPRWYLIDEFDQLHTEFPDICLQLKEKLSQKPKELEWRQESLETFIRKMRSKERELLPIKKKRVLEVAEEILRKKLKHEKKTELESLIKRILPLFRLQSKKIIVDFDLFAEQWITILQPYLTDKRKRVKNKRTVYNFRSLIREYRKINLDKNLLQKVLENCPVTDEIDKKIASCIIGVKTRIEN